MKGLPVWILLSSVLLLVVSTGCQPPQPGTGWPILADNSIQEQPLPVTPGQTVQSTSTMVAEQYSITCVNGICETVSITSTMTTMCVNGNCENTTESSVSK